MAIIAIMEKSHDPNQRDLSAITLSLECVNVAGGWQSAIKNTEFVFGPIYNDLPDLWVWQRDNIYGVQ